MAYWIAAHVPAWITGVVLIVVFPLATVGIQAVLRRAVPALKKQDHNEVAGFLVAVIGVAYAVIAGFTIIALWENFTDAQNATKVEALRATPLEQGSRVFGPATETRLRTEVIAYSQSVIDNWDTIKQGNASPQVRANIDAMFTTIENLKPTTEAQRAFVEEAEARLLDLSNERRDRIITTHEGELPSLMWIAILVASAITMMFRFSSGPRARACTTSWWPASRPSSVPISSSWLSSTIPIWGMSLCSRPATVRSWRSSSRTDDGQLDVVGGHLDPLGRPPLHRHLPLDRDRAAAGQGAQGRAGAALGQDRRMDAARQLAMTLTAHLTDDDPPEQLRFEPWWRGP
jgi:Protein of unknown function (DUF4239)